MQQKHFGTTDLTVSEIGFGCARLGGVLERGSKPDILRTLQSAFEEGVTFFDTADMYTGGESEKLLGEAFHGKRDKVVIATKVGYRLPAQKKAIAKIKPVLRPLVRLIGIERGALPGTITGSPSQEFSASYLIQAVEHSLRRLRTDYLDLYQLHSPPSSVLEDGDCFVPLEKLKAQGKIRYYGVSCETTQDAVICLQYPEISSLQVRLNLLDQSVLEEVLPRASGKGIAIVARECFAGGILSRSIEAEQREKVATDSAMHSRLEECLRLAERSRRPLAELAVNFVSGLEGTSVTLLGMRNLIQLADNLRHAAAPPLSFEEFQTVRDISSARNMGRA